MEESKSRKRIIEKILFLGRDFGLQGLALIAFARTVKGRQGGDCGSQHLGEVYG